MTSRRTEADTLANLLFSLVRSLHREMKNRADLPLNHSQMHTLFFIRTHENPLMREIAECLSIKPPSATTLIEELQAMGYVRRATDPKDRRSVRIMLTPRGHALIQNRLKLLAKYIEEMTTPLTSTERNQFISILKKIIPPADQTTV